MYEELVRRLRAECALPYGVIKDMREAADAIEDLMQKVTNAEAESGLYDALPVVDQRECWIPVTERLPKDGEFVLGCNDDKHMMIVKYETETYEWYYKYTNYDFDIWDNEEQGPVCYWMPLPEPPKEET